MCAALMSFGSTCRRLRRRAMAPMLVGRFYAVCDMPLLRLLFFAFCIRLLRPPITAS